MNKWTLAFAILYTCAAILIFSLLYNTVNAQNESAFPIASWQLNALELSNALASSAAVVNGSNIYVMGGKLSSGQPTDSVYLLKRRGGSLSVASLISLPESLYAHAAVLVRDQSGTSYIYVIGGWDGSERRDEVWRTTIESNGGIGQWVQHGGYPTGIALHNAVAVNSTIYVMGGEVEDGTTTASVYALDTTKNNITWQPKPQLLTALRRHSATVSGNTIIVTGGYDGTSHRNLIQTYIHGDDKSVGWEQSSVTLQHPMDYHATFTTQNRLVVIGGRILTSDGTMIPSQQVYSIGLDENNRPVESPLPSRTDLPVPLFRHALAVQHGTAADQNKRLVYAIGGIGKVGENFSYQRSIYQNGINSVPIASNDSRKFNENLVANTYNLSNLVANDSDTNGDTLTVIECVPDSKGASVEVNPEKDGCTLTLDSEIDFDGYNISYTVSDGFDTSSATVAVTINPASAGIQSVRLETIGDALNSQDEILKPDAQIQYRVTIRNGKGNASNLNAEIELPLSTACMQPTNSEFECSETGTKQITFSNLSIDQGMQKILEYTVNYNGGLLASIIAPTTARLNEGVPYTVKVTNNTEEVVSDYEIHIKFDKQHKVSNPLAPGTFRVSQTHQFTQTMPIKAGGEFNLDFDVFVENSDDEIKISHILVCRVKAEEEVTEREVVSTEDTECIKDNIILDSSDSSVEFNGLVTKIKSDSTISQLQTVHVREILKSEVVVTISSDGNCNSGDSAKNDLCQDTVTLLNPVPPYLYYLPITSQ